MPEKLNVVHRSKSANCSFLDDVKRLHPKVQKFLESKQCNRVLVACSGGADSIFMLHLLHANTKYFGIELIVAHYNHLWRGEDSNADAQFVETVARDFNHPFVLGIRSDSEILKTETQARDLRLKFLRASAKKHDCQCIAFGHQQNDILETQLQRLARGSGSDGLVAPRPVHNFHALPSHVRPLLNLDAHTIRETLSKNSISWREDASNAELIIPRNVLRNSIIPDLQNAFKHDVSKGAARSRELLEEDAIALDQLAREFIPEAFGQNLVLKRAVLSKAPRALTRRALRAWLSRHQLNDSLNATAFNTLIDAVYFSKKQFQLSAGAFFVKVESNSILIEQAIASEDKLLPCSFKAGSSAVLSTGAILETEIIHVDKTLRDKLLNKKVDTYHEAYIHYEPEKLFQIRSREPGDTFRPLGAPGSKKLKAWFIDRGIPIRERNKLPLVLTDSKTIAWVPGLPPADDLKIKAKTKTALKLTYKTTKPPSSH